MIMARLEQNTEQSNGTNISYKRRLTDAKSCLCSFKSLLHDLILNLGRKSRLSP